jgi:hypothetical protein
LDQEKEPGFAGHDAGEGSRLVEPIRKKGVQMDNEMLMQILKKICKK